MAHACSEAGHSVGVTGQCCPSNNDSQHEPLPWLGWKNKRSDLYIASLANRKSSGICTSIPLCTSLSTSLCEGELSEGPFALIIKHSVVRALPTINQ